MTVIIFIIVLAVLIFVHELGHFVAARIFGVRVDAFKLGFGPKLLAWKRGETEYGVNLIPFGGYVKIFGENPDDESTNGAHAHRSFVNKHRGKQVLVLAAGVLCNFIFAWLLYSIIFAVGITASTSGFEKYSANFTDERIMIVHVTPGSPADKAGLIVGDTIKYVETTAMNGERAKADISLKSKIETQSIEEIQKIIGAGGKMPVAIGYEREGDFTIIGVVATSTLVEGRMVIGISMDNVAKLKLPFSSAIGEGFHYTILLIKETFVGLYTFIANIFMGSPNFSDVAGPIGIAGIVGNAAKMGFTYLLMVTAIISINLGVVNLIPFPALDGGRILMVVIEGVFRRRIPNKIANAINMVGFALLMALMVVVTWKDIFRLWQ